MAGKHNLLLCGYSGRMGTMIAELCKQSKTFAEAMEFSSKKIAPKGSVLIDFSSPEGFRESLNYCVTNKLPFVSGTTGLKESDFKSLENAGKKIPVLWAANMSVGVHWVKKILANLGPLAKDYDFQIEEIHHKRKVDAPSGTAIDLQKSLEKAIGRKAPAPTSIRGGGVFGVHKIFVMGEEEVIAIEHQALDRRVFARGALKAAEFLRKQKPGIYSMEQVMGFD